MTMFQVHKELQDTTAQLEAIRHEIRSISVLNPSPLTRRLVDNPDRAPVSQEGESKRVSQRKELEGEQNRSVATISKECSSATTEPWNLHSPATFNAKLAESSLKSGSLKEGTDVNKLGDDIGPSAISPVSAEIAT